MTTTRKGWGKSVTWATMAEARAAAEARQQRYGPEAITIYRTARGRFSLRAGRKILTLEPVSGRTEGTPV